MTKKRNSNSDHYGEGNSTRKNSYVYDAEEELQQITFQLSNFRTAFGLLLRSIDPAFSGDFDEESHEKKVKIFFYNEENCESLKVPAKDFLKLVEPWGEKRHFVLKAWLNYCFDTEDLKDDDDRGYIVIGFISNLRYHHERIACIKEYINESFECADLIKITNALKILFAKYCFYESEKLEEKKQEDEYSANEKMPFREIYEEGDEIYDLEKNCSEIILYWLEFFPKDQQEAIVKELVDSEVAKIEHFAEFLQQSSRDESPSPVLEHLEGRQVKNIALAQQQLEP